MQATKNTKYTNPSHSSSPTLPPPPPPPRRRHSVRSRSPANLAAALCIYTSDVASRALHRRIRRRRRLRRRQPPDLPHIRPDESAAARAGDGIRMAFSERNNLTR